MVYDPLSDQPRYRPHGNGSSAVDTLLDPVMDPPPPVRDEPSTVRGPGIVPAPTDAWSERLLYSVVGVSAVLGAAAGLAALRLLCKARRRQSR